MNEFELKFQVPPQRAAAVEEALRRGSVQRQALRARYFDTADGALERAGIALRLRREGKGWVQTVKAPGRGGFERLEHNAPVRAVGTADLPDPARHAGHPAHGALMAALGGSTGPLQAVFATEITREARTVSASGSRVEVALDRGRIRSGTRTQPVLELEFELKQGSHGVLVELARGWCRHHELWLDPLTKAGAGRRLARGDASSEPVAASAPQAAGRHLLAGILDAALHQVLGNARELAAGTGTDEHIHQLRVGLRRLRVALRELREGAAVNPWEPQAQQALRELFTVLGEHRDRATVLPAMLQQLAQAGCPVPPWTPELPDVGAAVRCNAVQDALIALVGLSEELREGEGERPRLLRARTGARLERLHKALRPGRRFEELPVEERHRVRKRLKRQRYLAELARPLYAGSRVDAYVEALKAAQDSLGLYQDAVAGRAVFEQRAAEDPQAWFGAGWLAAREAELARQCAKACRRAAREAKPFWD